MTPGKSSYEGEGRPIGGMERKKKIIRITTVPQSLLILLEGQMKFMKEQGYEVIGLTSSGPEIEEIKRREDVPVKIVEMTRTISPLADLKSLIQVYRFLVREKPFIVHSHTPKAGIVGMMAAWMAGVPHRLHTIAGLPLLEARGAKRRMLELVERLTYSLATRVYPNSRGLMDIVIKANFAPPSKFRIIGQGSSNGIDEQHFDPAKVDPGERHTLRTRLGLEEKDFVFLFIGRVVRDKGIHELIDAFGQVSRDRPWAKLMILGRYEDDLDPVEPDTRAEIDRNPQIHYLGFQADVRPYLAISDLLVFPSYREGFPNVVMQASAMGKASLVTNINGCNEIIAEGVNGWIVEPKQTAPLAERMAYAIEHPEEVEAMASRARDRVVSQFSRAYIWNALAEEYRSLETIEK